MIQREVIDRHLLDMKAMVAELQRHQGLSVDELQTDRLVLLAVERALQRAIQNLIDISMHVLSGAGINDWDDYRGVILKLGEESIVPAEFAQRICGMAGTRNILVHGYIRVEVEKIRDLLQHHLDDFGTFAVYIVEYLKKKGETGK